MRPVPAPRLLVLSTGQQIEEFLQRPSEWIEQHHEQAHDPRQPVHEDIGLLAEKVLGANLGKDEKREH